jgi:hypothetical protein
MGKLPEKLALINQIPASKRMSSIDQIPNRPEVLWTQDSNTPSVGRYLRAHRGEFNTGSMESGYPYCGPASKSFRRLAIINPHEGYERFEGLGTGCWTLKSDGILNNLTTDLLAAADLLGGISASKSVSALPGGIGIDASKVWVSLLDGGVGVDVHISEHEITNRLSGKQRTTIRGPRAFRVLLDFLGFDWSNRKLIGEAKTPTHSEITSQVDQLLSKRNQPA